MTYNYKPDPNIIIEAQNHNTELSLLRYLNGTCDLIEKMQTLKINSPRICHRKYIELLSTSCKLMRKIDVTIETFPYI